MTAGAERVHADMGYRGSWTDTDLWPFNLSFIPARDLMLWPNYSETERNLDRVADKPVPFETALSFGAAYNIPDFARNKIQQA